MAQNMKRGRNQRRRPNSNNPNRALDSTGPEVKIRGTALQIYDKYQTLARDASSSGDRIRAESLLQHAEHYFRLMKASQPPQQQQQDQQDQTGEPQPEISQDNPETTDTQSTLAQADASTGDTGETETTLDADTEKPKRARRRRPARKSTVDEGETATDKPEATAAE